MALPTGQGRESVGDHGTVEQVLWRVHLQDAPPEDLPHEAA